MLSASAHGLIIMIFYNNDILTGSFLTRRWSTERSRKYKITLKHVLVFYEFTGTINYRFLTNQNARTILVFIKEKSMENFGWFVKLRGTNLSRLRRSLGHFPV